MPETSLLSRAQDLADQASVKAEEYSGLFSSAREYILDTFGPNGLLAAYIIAAVLVLVIVSRLAKITFSTAKYLVVPAVALAFVATFFLPYSFLSMLPVTATASSLFFLFKG
jgi:hypothetical protein